MKMIKSVTLLESASGNKQFAVKASAPSPAKEASKANATELATGAIGTRSTSSTVKNPTDQLEVAKHFAAAEVKETAAMDSESGLGNAGAPSGSAMSDVVSNNSIIDVLSGVVARHDPKKHSTSRCDIYRDMYYYDATCGSAIDLLATIPWSDFSLVGLKDEKMTKTFVESIEAMNCATLLPNISIDYNALGGSVLSTRWDENDRKYKGIAAHRLDLCTFTQVPVFGVDPIIEVTLPEELLDGLRNQAVQDKYKNYIPNDLLEMLGDGGNNSKSSGGKSGGSKGGVGITLKPEHTIFIPRRAFLKDYSGVSLLQRALPAWLYEKALIRGTLDQVYKKQRATTHITVEATEDWVPSQEEMNQIAQLFLNADLDPLGAIVVTRNGVSVNEVRRGDDFWRWDQNYDAIEKIKLRALGISETFVSGDATYATMEQTLSVFMENVRDYRSRLTREIFYEKVFPTIATANGYTRKKYGNRVREVARFGGTEIGYDKNNELYAIIGSDMPVYREFAAADPAINASDYVIPQVQWHKRLMPEADGDYLAILGTLEEKGVPVSIRHWIAAGGMKVEALMDGLEQDLEDRTKILEYRKEIQELNKEFGIQQEGQGGEGGEGGEGGDSEEFANFLIRQRMGIGGVRRRSILSRGNPDSPEAEISDRDGRGHRRVMTRKGRMNKVNKYHKVIAEAAAEVGRRENARNKAEAGKRDWSKKIYV